MSSQWAEYSAAGGFCSFEFSLPLPGPACGRFEEAQKTPIDWPVYSLRAIQGRSGHSFPCRAGTVMIDFPKWALDAKGNLFLGVQLARLSWRLISEQSTELFPVSRKIS